MIRSRKDHQRESQYVLDLSGYDFAMEDYERDFIGLSVSGRILLSEMTNFPLNYTCYAKRKRNNKCLHSTA